MGEAREKKYTHFVNALRNKYFSLVFSFFVSCFNLCVFDGNV